MDRRWYFIATLLAGFLWIGCESSEEAMRREAEAQQRLEEQQRLAELTSENSSLKQQVSRLESENSGLQARLSEVEKKLEEATRVPEPAAPAPMPAMDPMSAYEAGLQAFNEKRYDDAIGIFQELLNNGVEESLADNCHYWIGESLFGKRAYGEAMNHFGMVLEYKVTEKKGDAYYMMGRCHEMQGDKAKAKELYEKVVKDYPTNDLVKKAKGRWEKL